MKKKHPTPGETLAKEILAQYQPQTIAEMQSALKDIFGPMFEAMLQGEMSRHLGYARNDHSGKPTTTAETAIRPRPSIRAPGR